tara:strand:- start:186 stop:404 length:219 start_codon:yes stop_codon:yes gene_type:complete
MGNQTFSTNVDVDSWERKEQLLEKGRQLHNQAIQQMFIMVAKGLSRSLKKSFGDSSKDRKFGYFYEEIPAKK